MQKRLKKLCRLICENRAKVLKQDFEIILTGFTVNGVINIKNAVYMEDERPIDSHCDCPVCKTYSRAYLRHLFKAEEILAMRLAVMHNLYFYNKMAQKIRDALDEGTFEQFRAKWSPILDKRIVDGK